MKTKQIARQLSVTVDDRTLKLLDQLSTKTMFNKSLIVRMLIDRAWKEFDQTGTGSFLVKD